MIAALRQFTEVDSHKALVSVMLLDQHRVVKEVVGSAFDNINFPAAKRTSGPEKLTSRAGERMGQEAVVHTTRVDHNRWRIASSETCWKVHEESHRGMAGAHLL